MFSFWKRDPQQQLQNAYARKMKQAKDAEKYGDRALQADLYAEADALLTELDRLRSAP